jgi:hypothetical protein
LFTPTADSHRVAREEMVKRKPRRGIGVGAALARVLWLGAAIYGAWWAWDRWGTRAVPKRLGGLAVHARSEWKASEVSGESAPMSGPDRITVHHLGGKAFTTRGKSATRRVIKAIQEDHQKRRGWSDIGYHYIVDRDGQVWEGRSATIVGAHAGSAAANDANLGVLVLGNFDLQSPPGAQLAGLEKLLRALCRKHRIPRDRIFTHREVREACGLDATQCPGRELEAWVARWGAAARG